MSTQSSTFDGWHYGSTAGRLNAYLNKYEQLTANIGWRCMANNAIATADQRHAAQPVPE